MRFLIIILLFLSFENTVAQNLVPNAGFENYLLCPDMEDQIDRAISWSKFSANNTTPDYYNSCANPGNFSVPDGNICFQYAKSGNAFAGLVTFAVNNYREHIGTQLLQPTVIGTKYFVSFYASLCERGTLLTPSNNIGLKFSTDSFSPLNPAPINNFAHIYSNTIIDDSINWIFVTGSFIADSVYTHIILGNFFDNSNTDTLQYVSNISSISYYIIDDICISTDSLDCNIMNSISDQQDHADIIVYPNPGYDRSTISSSRSKIKSIELKDIHGKQVFHKNFIMQNKIDIDVSSLQSMMFVVIITLADNSVKYYKLIKQK